MDIDRNHKDRHTHPTTQTFDMSTDNCLPGGLLHANVQRHSSSNTRPAITTSSPPKRSRRQQCAVFVCLLAMLVVSQPQPGHGEPVENNTATVITGNATADMPLISTFTNAATATASFATDTTTTTAATATPSAATSTTVLASRTTAPPHIDSCAGLAPLADQPLHSEFARMTLCTVRTAISPTE